MESQQCKYANLKVSPSELNFSVNEGWQFVPPQQAISVEKDGAGMSPPWNAIANEEWVRMSSASGKGTGKVRLSCSSVGMPSGIYSALVEVKSWDSIVVTNPIVLVTLTVHPLESPSPPTPPPDPDPEPEPDPEPPPDPDPDPEPPPPDPDPEPPKEDWMTRFIKWMESIFDWLFDRLGDTWKK